MDKPLQKAITKLNTHSSETFKSGQVIVSTGKRTKDVYYITDGYVKVYDLNDSGDIKIISILKEGDMFPLIWGFDHPPETAYYYKATGPTSTLRVSTEELKKALEQDPVVSRTALLQFVYYTWDLMERIKGLQMPYTYEKLLRLFPYLAAKLGVKRSENVYELAYNLTQEEIAQLLGATRESISAHLHKVEDSGAIQRVGKKITVKISSIPEEYIHEQWFRESSD